MNDPAMLVIGADPKPKMTPVTDDDGNGVNVTLPDFSKGKEQPGGTYEAKIRFKLISRDGAPEGETENSSDQDEPSEGESCEIEIMSVGECKRVKDQRPMSFPREDEDSMESNLAETKKAIPSLGDIEEESY